MRFAFFFNRGFEIGLNAFETVHSGFESAVRRSPERVFDRNGIIVQRDRPTCSRRSVEASLVAAPPYLMSAVEGVISNSDIHIEETLMTIVNPLQGPQTATDREGRSV